MRKGIIHPVNDPVPPELHLPPADVPTGAGAAALRSMVGSAWSILRRRWKLALAVGALTLAPFGLFAVYAVPTYTSQGVLQVAQDMGGGLGPMMELLGTNSSSQVETEVEILKRREFVLLTLKQLRLHVRSQTPMGSVSTDLDISRGRRSPTPPQLSTLRHALERIELDPNRFDPLDISMTIDTPSSVTLTWTVDREEQRRSLATHEILETPSLTFALNSIPFDPGDVVNFTVVSDGALLDDTLPQLHIQALGSRTKTTDLVSVQFTHHDRAIAQSVVQGIMTAYLAQSLEWQSQGASKAALFIEQQLADAEEQLHTAEDALRAFSEREHAVELDTQAQVTIENVAALEAERRKALLEANVLASVRRGLRQRTKSGGSAHLTANFLEDPVLGEAISALTQGETRYATLSATLTADHPTVRDLGRALTEQRKEVERLISSSQKAASTRAAALDEQLKSASAALSSFPDKNLQLARLMRDVEVYQKMYAFLLERHREAEILEASTTVDKRIVDGASLPHRMTTPQRGNIIFSGAILAALAALVAVNLAYLLQRRLATIEQIKAEIPFPVYGTLPLIERDDGASRPGKRAIRLPHAIIWGNNHSAASEAFRALCVNLSLTPLGAHQGRVIAIASSQPGEGKSMVVSNLAVALSKSGQRILLIDLDLRKPVQHREWRIARDPGYSDLLASPDPHQPNHQHDFIRHNDDYGVDVITAGSRLPDTLSSLMTPQLPELLTAWRSKYDYIVIDSPPAFVSDAAVVAQLADLVLLVCRPGLLERSNARSALHMLERIHSQKGLVFNGVSRNNIDDYGYGGYYYAYASNYTDDSAPVAPSRSDAPPQHDDTDHRQPPSEELGRKDSAA